MLGSNFYPRTPQKSATAVEAFSDALRMISIHAPYKRVRRHFLEHQRYVTHISIHAPYKRVRLTNVRNFLLCWYNFNPRTLQESATAKLREKLYGGSISIHAPYKRVRQPQSRTLALGLIFQSTHPTRECDTVRRFIVAFLLQFQSTHPTRECDLSYNDDLKRHVISIHAPYKRVRLMRYFRPPIVP